MVAVLTCLHNVVELNSSAKVIGKLHELLEAFAEVLKEDLV